MLEAILIAAGYKVGLYMSPHLIDFNERIRVNGNIADDAQIVQQFARIEAARAEVSLSYFEFATLAALLTFADEKLDVAILEVGLGGRLDAVNILDPDCAIVTSIDLDHMQWLGDTREQIALEKAHIFRTGRPAICADPVPPQSLINHAESIGADLWLFGRDFNYSGDRQQWAYGGRDKRRPGLAYPALRGANQLLNASAALAAIEALHPRLAVPQQSIRIGLAQVSLPGRMQILPGSPVVVLDVAHNPHAAAVLAQNLENMPFYPYTHAVIGMFKDKNVEETLQKLASKVDHWYCADIDGPRAAAGNDLAQIIKKLVASRPPDEVVTTAVFDNPVQAFKAAQNQAAENDRILVFGSFHTVGPILKELGRKAR
jgi:dihydrofolate synthase/folylpolyglutamate synthase